MSNIVVRFDDESDFLEELHKDLEEYAVQIVDTVRVTQQGSPDHCFYVVVSYVRNNEVVKLFDFVGMDDEPDVHERALAKEEYYLDLIKEEEIAVKKGEYILEE